MKRLILLSIGILTFQIQGYSQIDPNAFGFYNEALRFSQRSFGGSARILGLGGAQVSLGGDMSTALSNPAGLGFYNRSEFVFTPSLNFNDTDATYFGTSTNDTKTRFNFNNIGAVLARPSDISAGGFKGGSFAISLHKVNDFNNRFTYESNQVDVDFFDFVLDNINSGNNNLFTDLAFETFLIDLFVEDVQGTDTTFIYGYVDSFFDNNGVLQIFPDFPDLVTESVETKGGEYQINFAYGANFNDRFYIGANIGFSSLDFRRKRIYREFRSDGVLDDFTLEENLDIQGSGVNATIGVIARPVQQLTLGMSFVTPTFYNIDDEFEALMVSNFNSSYIYPPDNAPLGQQSFLSDLFISNYTLRTPWKLNTGASYFFGKSGFISADVEIVDYSRSHLSSDDFSMTADNRTIDNIYENAVNYRIGGEYRYNILRFRAGFSHHSDPVKGDFGDVNQSVNSIHFGAGVKLPKFFFDLGFVQSNSDTAISPYTLIDGTRPIAEIDNSRLNAVVSVGFNF